MATRTLNRRALRAEHDSETDETERDATDESAEETEDEDAPKPRARKKASKARAPAKAKAKTAAKPRARKKTVKVAPRMFARWAVCDNGMKRVAVFEYKDRAAADVKLAQIRESKAGTFFLLLVKDPYDPPEEPVVPVVPSATS
jgi:hypothetical protein